MLSARAADLGTFRDIDTPLAGAVFSIRQTPRHGLAWLGGLGLAGGDGFTSDAHIDASKFICKL
jgi:hypothetical protein